MPYAKKVVLHCPFGASLKLDALVEDFIRDGVRFVAVVGSECERIEELIDWSVIGPDGKRDYDLLTSSHPEESVEEVIEFAKSLTGEFAGHEIQVVTLAPDNIDS